MNYTVHTTDSDESDITLLGIDFQSMLDSIVIGIRQRALLFRHNQRLALLQSLDVSDLVRVESDFDSSLKSVVPGFQIVSNSETLNPPKINAGT